MFAQAIEDILKDHCSPAAVRDIEAGGSPAAMWSALENAGFLELLATEDAGGACLPLPELYDVLAVLGRYAVPLPVGQTIVARSLLGSSPAPAGMITLAQGLRRDDAGLVHCDLTPFGMVADIVIAADGGDLLVLPAAGARRAPTGVHASLVASLAWPEGAGVRLHGGGMHLPAFGAALHAALMAGAMGRVFELTLQHCNDRAQFGKTLGKFQAVQHQLSVMAEHVAAASIAAQAAFRTAAMQPALLGAAVAKSRASEAAVLVTATSHALHGAIGITQEYDLQLWTRRLQEWRLAHGSEFHWNRVVGQMVLDDSRPVTDMVRDI